MHGALAINQRFLKRASCRVEHNADKNITLAHREAVKIRKVHDRTQNHKARRKNTRTLGLDACNLHAFGERQLPHALGHFIEFSARHASTMNLR